MGRSIDFIFLRSLDLPKFKNHLQNYDQTHKMVEWIVALIAIKCTNRNQKLKIQNFDTWNGGILANI